MNNLPKKEFQKYLKSIKKELNCSSNLKKERITEFLNENPNASMNDLIDEFGNSKEIADSFGSCNLSKLKKNAKKYFYAKILISILIICLIIVTIFLIHYINSIDDIIITN